MKPTVAIIQARMGSTRFPGKVLRPLLGRPVLAHLLTRLRRARSVDVIALATTEESEDDALVPFADAEGVRLVRGATDDVLGRFVKAAEATGAGTILRVTGDAPLVDPELIDRLVGALHQVDADFAMTEPGVASIHEGFSPFSRRALDRLRRTAAADPEAREHITAYFKRHPEEYRVVSIPVDESWQYRGARVSVDTPADVAFLEAICRELGTTPSDVDLRALVALLRRRPELVEINQRVRQKRSDERTRMAIVRCDGGHAIGRGHVQRCLSIAEALRSEHGWGVRFAVVGDDASAATIAAEGFGVERLPADGEGAALRALMARLAADALLVDVRSELTGADLQGLPGAPLVLALDDGSERRLAADVAVYPPVPQVAQLDWRGFRGECLTGWEYMVLGPAFSRGPGPLPSRDGEGRLDGRPRILVTLGASDPSGLTVRALAALEALPGPLAVDVVVGPAARPTSLPPTRHERVVHERVADLRPLADGAALAVTAMGVTVHELTSRGVPCVVVARDEDTARSLSALADAGAAVAAGLDGPGVEERLMAAVGELLAAPGQRDALARRGPALIDGAGAHRVAAAIVARAGRGQESAA